MTATFSSVVLLSGGQDSTTALYWAKAKFPGLPPLALCFGYGQRHQKEVLAAEQLSSRAGAVYKYMDLSQVFLSMNLQSALLTAGSLSEQHVGNPKLPSTFTPGRNIVFHALAQIIAYQCGVSHVVSGVCQTDFVGYPDCRDYFVRLLALAVNFGLESDIQFHTPLMFLTKSQTVELAQTLPGCMDALAFSWTCYEGKEEPCQHCPSCVLRAQGFALAGVPDPALGKRV